MTTDVLVVGGGPAGRALAAATAERGLHTVLVDPAPAAPWRQTFGSWWAELPADLPGTVLAARASGLAFARGEHRLGWEYAVLDVAALRALLDARLTAAGVEVRAGRAVGVVAGGRRRSRRAGPRRDRPGGDGPGGDELGGDELGGDELGGDEPGSDELGGDELGGDELGDEPSGDRLSGVVLADGSILRAGLVVDAGGARQPLAPTPPAGRRTRRPPSVPAEQAAYGLLLPTAAAAPVVAPGSALFMDWRPDHGETGPPTFLYAVPVGPDTVLLEETSLARRPGLPIPVLRRRLLARLARRGVDPTGAPDERVLFRLDTPRHRTPGLLGFGAAAPLVHPATGFGLATALTLAPRVADAVAATLPRGSDAALTAARRVLWSPAARAVHRFRRTGLEALLRMPPESVPDFFELFFGLPQRHRWNYLTGRADLPGTAATMAALFGAADWAMRSRLVTPALRGPAPPAG